MHSFKIVSAFTATVAVAGIAALAALSGQQFSPVATTTAVAAVAAVAKVETTTPAISLAAPAAAAAVAVVMPEEALRARIRWIPTHWGQEKTVTLDAASRLLLAQAAAERAGLSKVGLSFQDVYGVVNAETSWIPRSGMGKNGTESHGLAQFEPRTAKGLGLKNPNDPVEAVYYAAVNMKHGAEWAASKIAHLNLSPVQYAAKLREGVSIYYNLSIRGRNKWDGQNTAQLPVETQRHIRNVQWGAERATQLAEEIVG
jgi:hypothetical protein